MNSCAFKLNACGLSHVGKVRDNNEDVISILEDQGFFALADGMGGHQAGEIAAQEAVRFVCTSIEELFLSQKHEWNIFELSSFNRLCIENANSWVHHLGKKKAAYRGMGTTLCTLLFYESSLIYGHVGDSRIYRFRDNTLEQMTEDHSLHNQMLAKGTVSHKHSNRPAYRNILTRAIGTQNDVEAEIHIAPVISHDIYLMCTDGLTDQVNDKEIASILRNAPDLRTASATLIQRSNEKGGQDNVTVLMVQADEYEQENLPRQ